MAVRILARCVHGLEWVCADEVSRRYPEAAGGLEFARRQVSFDLAEPDAGLLELSTVDDVFLVAGVLDDVGSTRDTPPVLAARLPELPFPALLDAVRALRPLPARPAFDVVASLEGRRNYNRYAVENTAGPALTRRLRGLFLARTPDGVGAAEPDLSVRLFLRGTTAVAAVRLARRPLHRRAYKQHAGPGTLHPPLAAALARLAEPGLPGPLLDPFCGDGTIAIEAARQAHPTGTADRLVIGAELDPTRLANAHRNAALAGVRPALVRADAAHPPWRRGTIAAVVTNPPWNLAVDAAGALHNSLTPFWHHLPALLTPTARLAAVVDADLAAPVLLRKLGYQIGLHATIRLAGRLSDLVLAAPPGGAAVHLEPALTAYRRQAITAGVVSEYGF